jgi:hypothetical protein
MSKNLSVETEDQLRAHFYAANVLSMGMAWNFDKEYIADVITDLNSTPDVVREFLDDCISILSEMSPSGFAYLEPLRILEVDEPEVNEPKPTGKKSKVKP